MKAFSIALDQANEMEVDLEWNSDIAWKIAAWSTVAMFVVGGITAFAADGTLIMAVIIAFFTRVFVIVWSAMIIKQLNTI